MDGQQLAEEETMQKLLDDQHKDMKLQIQGLIPPGQQLHRNVLFDQLYASIPKDPEAKVRIYTAELAPKGWTISIATTARHSFWPCKGCSRRIRGGHPHPRESRRRVFGADREDASRPQPARNAPLPLRGLLRHRAGS
jgi:hypothetical protein